MGLFRDLWRQKGSLQVVRATCCYYLSLLANYCSLLLYWSIIRYSIVKEATIQIAKTTIRFSTSIGM